MIKGKKMKITVDSIVAREGKIALQIAIATEYEEFMLGPEHQLVNAKQLGEGL